MDGQADVLLERSGEGGQIAVLRLNRPQALNALRHDTVRRLYALIDELAADETARVVVLTGAGRGFCAGWDLKSPLTDAAGAPLQGAAGVTDYIRGQELFAGLVKRLRALDKVVIAAINGVVVGAGLGMALAADIRVAARSASFHIGAVRIGLTAGECGISYHLPRLVGASRAFELMLTGRPFDTAEALEMGLLSAVVDDDQVLAHALKLAAQVLANSPYATRHTKQLMWANLNAPTLDAALELENRAQVIALMTEDFREASAAFAEKRAPQYTGR